MPVSRAFVYQINASFKTETFKLCEGHTHTILVSTARSASCQILLQSLFLVGPQNFLAKSTQIRSLMMGKI